MRPLCCIALALFLATSACGFKGPLTLPDKAAPTQAPEKK